MPMTAPQENKMKLIRIKEVCQLTSLARSTVYKFVAEGTFPKQVVLGSNCVAWVESEIHEWLKGRIAERDSTRE